MSLSRPAELALAGVVGAGVGIALAHWLRERPEPSLHHAVAVLVVVVGSQEADAVVGSLRARRSSTLSGVFECTVRGQAVRVLRLCDGFGPVDAAR